MTTHFITAEIEINENQEAIAKSVEQELAKHGEPLRWAIASVDSKVDAATNLKTQTAHIEAVVAAIRRREQELFMLFILFCRN